VGLAGVAEGDPVTPDRVPPRLETDGGGGLTYWGARYLLVRPETLVAMQKAVEAALGERAAACLVAGGRAGGGAALQSLEGSPAEIVERLLAMGGQIGWGAFVLERLAPDELVVTVQNSPFAKAYGAAATPVCHLTRGVLERLAELALGAPAVATETACVATGAPACRFAARVR
jgi:predicted hydrocarbon binding protein